MLDIGQIQPLFGVKIAIDRSHGDPCFFGKIGEFHLLIAHFFKKV